MNTPNPTAPLKRKNPDTLRRYNDGIAPTPGTIKHDNLAEAYRRGAVDALRTVIIAAQTALAKREERIDKINQQADAWMTKVKRLSAIPEVRTALAKRSTES